MDYIIDKNAPRDAAFSSLPNASFASVEWWFSSSNSASMALILILKVNYSIIMYQEMTAVSFARNRSRQICNPDTITTSINECHFTFLAATRTTITTTLPRLEALPTLIQLLVPVQLTLTIIFIIALFTAKPLLMDWPLCRQ